MAREVPVYLFVGFLESGKSRFIQQTLEDERFNGGEKTLLLCCEEGEEEFEPDYFASPNVFIEYVDEPETLTPEYLKGLLKKYRIDKVMVEYNGMWLLEQLYAALPREMVVYQQFTFIDSTTFEAYNNNMRNLMVDKLRDCELVVFNRFTDEHDKMLRHKIVRASNRMCEIAYEYSDTKIVYDDIIDPPPYDINAPIVEIEDKDFAWWYSDILNDPRAFEGKTVRFSGFGLIDDQLPRNSFLFGRQLMNCCEADISFAGFAAEAAMGPLPVKNRQWYVATGKIEFRYHEVYESKGPVLKVMKLQSREEPEEPVATFL